MNPISHIFFDLHNTLVDGVKLHPCYSAAYGRLMAEHYGLTPDVWADANKRIVADWDSYYADLDLGGENGLADMWEGYFRTTRAMFRIVGVPEPEYEEVMALAREIPGYATRNCDAFYEDTKPVIRKLYELGFTLGIATHALVIQAQGTLQGGKVIDYFKGPLIGPDVTEQFNKDGDFYAYAARVAQVRPERCLVVDDNTHAIRGAKQIGMQTVQICRGGLPPRSIADHVMADLTGLIDLLTLGK